MALKSKINLGIFLKTSATVSTLFESEGEWQKIKLVPIPIPRVFRNFPDVKTRFFSMIGH